MAGGDYYLYVETDSDNYSIYEHTDEANNITAGSLVTILPYPPVDLSVSAFTVTGTATSGNSVDVSWTVQNIGDAKTLVSSWDDKLFLSLDNQLRCQC